MSEPDSPHAAEQQSPETTYWYVWSDPKPLGPFLFNRLRQMAVEGRLTVDDHVRKGSSNPWVRAGDLTGLLFPDPTDLASIPPSQDEASADDEELENAAGTFFGAIRDWIEAFWDELRYGAAERLSSVRVLVSWVALVGVITGLIIAFWDRIPFGSLFAPDPLRVYYSIWDELKAKRETGATDQEWDVFSERARRELQPIVRRLEKTASADNQLSQRLLWAGRDYLPQMLKDSRTAACPAEERLGYELQLAAWTASGRDRRGNRVGHKLPATFFALNTDVAMILFGIAFVAADVGLVVWFLRRRRNAR